ncbi:MAG: HAMP domain-containing sensor histidine kinase [Gemmatimonadota bacterium]|jgi:signal transduction histidine kinase
MISGATPVGEITPRPSPRAAEPRGPDRARAAGLADQRARAAQEELLARPEWSIRSRIVVVFVLLFVLCSGGTVAAVTFLSAFEDKIVFLENAETYALEIEEARRNEKNYFLYRSGLPEALASANLARSHLERSADPMRAVAGTPTYQSMRGGLDRYVTLLERLARGDVPPDGPEAREIEINLRTEGAQLVSEAQEMIDRERAAVASMLHTSMVAAVGFLGFMLLIMVLFGGFVIRAVIRPLERFMDYVSRIADGNYEPIGPARRYRDEFSRLALAFNRMLDELLTRQDQLVQSGKMAAVGTLTSGIAHELNNPLNNIGLTVEALTDDFDAYSAADKRRMLDQIYTQVERASSTVKNLLDFTRKDRSAFTALEIADVVGSAVRLVNNEATLAGVEWAIDVGGELPRVRGSPHDLQQVFINLFLNAIQGMPDGGRLTVVAREEKDGFVRVEVGDTGIGIAPEHLPQIFDPFFTTKEPGAGTGLGLSVTHSIVEKHGGRIGVQSEPGAGTLFSVHLPTAVEAS